MNQAVDTTDFSHRYVRVEGLRIHCVVAGSGEPVLLVPGWPQTWYAWRHVMQALAAQGFMAIAVDPPGLGDSDRPEHGYDTGSIAQTLHQVMAQLGFSRYHLVGHDVGMWIAYALACDHPDAVRTLAVTEAIIPGLAEAPPIFVAPEENIFLWHFLFNQVRDLPELRSSGLARGDNAGRIDLLLRLVERNAARVGEGLRGLLPRETRLLAWREGA